MTPVDIDHLEKLHAEATTGPWSYYPSTGRVEGVADIIVFETPYPVDHDGECAAATHNALPALIAEVRYFRKLFDDAGQGEHNVLALIDHYQNEAQAEFAERKRIAEASDRAIIAATEKAIEHLEARMRDEAELRALREVARCAREVLAMSRPSLETCLDVARDDLTTALAKVPR